MIRIATFLITVFLAVPIAAQSREIKVAAVEFAAKSPGFEVNLPGIMDAVTAAAKNGAKLIVLPEGVTTGFAYVDAKSLMPYADTVPGKTTALISKITQQYNVYVVVGMMERDPITKQIHNAAVLIGPKGYIGKYHKNTLATGEGVAITPGKLGFPVFDTEIGRIGLVICFDDTNLQNLLLPVLRGADIVAQPIGSNKMASIYAASYTNHSTMANISTAVSWMGSNVISANSTGSEGFGKVQIDFFDGASSIWDNSGKRLISAPLSTPANPTKPQTIYATINLDKKSAQKEYWFKHRRPELYQDINSYRYPDDGAATYAPKQVSAALIQYEPKLGQVDENYKRVDQLIRERSGVFNLTVLPFNSFLGPVRLNKDNIAQYAEELNGKSYQLAAGLAKKYSTFVLFSMPEKKDGKYYETAVLFDGTGSQAGLYRKSHLNDSEKNWATAGNDLPIFKTSDFGNIAIMLDDEVRIPELTQMYGIYRADLILVPAAYNQKDYGGPVDIPKGVVQDASNKGMSMWYSIAKYAQAYTLVANYIGGEHQDIGDSAVYALTPEVGYYPPNIAPKKELAHLVDFTTHTNNTVYIDQERLIASRRWDEGAPIALDMNSACFKEWRKNSTSKEICPNSR
ncbi:MAG: carbon-nitrogen hydrolase family protein [Polynucleobacter sp.]|jgi:predicted amidohydrolase|uniref:carbon-nitrogen hydrolase family protein n=1 Tax=Polynucleobacter sp. TaxID=2029855 RepID=UPI0021737956|nr:carbon-nitrogen hydrolase family protein [Polynucleobacter sp.]MBU3670019.1 carbon-nitrogen hydrolase family protein [Polynucleobacter sp.]